MKIEVTNNQLEYIGLLNPDNKVTIRTADVEAVGALVSQPGAKKASTLKMTVPITRSECGTRRVAEFELNGHQMRSLYETLDRFYQTQFDSGNV